MGRSRPKDKEPHLLINRSRSQTNLPPTKPSHKNRHLHHLKIYTRTQLNIHKTKQHRIRSLLINQRTTGTTFFSRSKELEAKAALGPVEEDLVRFLHRKNEEYYYPNKLIRGQNTGTSMSLCSSTRNRTKPKRNPKD